MACPPPEGGICSGSVHERLRTIEGMKTALGRARGAGEGGAFADGCP